MIIKELTLYTNELEREKKFYTQTLGFDFEENCSNMFSVKIGRTKLNFQQTEMSHRYHYCFLIPANQLASAIKWLENRVAIIEIEKGKVIQRFESWNADSIYFYDGSGNIAEFIVRYDLKNESEEEFGLSSIISVNEIGLATKNVAKTNQQLADGINSEFWKGNNWTVRMRLMLQKHWLLVWEETVQESKDQAERRRMENVQYCFPARSLSPQSAERELVPRVFHQLRRLCD